MVGVTLKTQLTLYLSHFDMTAAQLSRRSGVSKQVISQWLSGAAPRKVDQLKTVAEVFETSIDHLCFGEGLGAPKSHQNGEPLDLLGDEWISGHFEIKIRRIKR